MVVAGRMSEKRNLWGRREGAADLSGAGEKRRALIAIIYSVTVISGYR